MGVNENTTTGEHVQWISFRVPSGEYAVLISDVGWKDGTPVLIDDEHAILVSAVYPVKHGPDGIGFHWKDTIRESGRIEHIIKEGLYHEPPLKEFFLMICDWIASGVLNTKSTTTRH